jgi:integrase
MLADNAFRGCVVVGQRDLSSTVDEYVLFHPLSPAGEYRMRRSIRVFESSIGRRARVADLSDPIVSAWVAWLESRYSPKSTYGFRGDLMTLWRDCAARGYCAPPGRVRRVPKPIPLPIAWTTSEFGMLLRCVRQLEGNFRRTGNPRSTYCVALLLAAFDTGLRRSDLWELDRRQIRPDGSILLRQRKTSRPCQPRLRPATIPWIEALRGDRPLCCPFASPSRWYQFWRRVTATAGVRHGGLQMVRRTGATHLAIEHRSDVQRYLGHRTADMQRHYVDESIASPQQHLPPLPPAATLIASHRPGPAGGEP